jgi:PAS domain S-box-containing protein
MSTPTAEPKKPSKLRADAEARLKEGSAPPTKGWPTGVSALSLLHKLASAPASADDALKLLHELQVHQVELDLQHEQMESTQRELAEDLARYKGLYEFAPVGYFSVGPEGDIIEANLAGAGLFGVGQEELRGRRIDSFLAPESRPVLLEWLKRLRGGASGEACEAKSGGGRVSRQLQVVASVAPGGGSFLMVFVDTTDRKQPDQRA